MKQVCHEHACSMAGSYGKRTVCDYYQLISEQVSPFPVSGSALWKCTKQPLMHFGTNFKRLSGKLICVFFPPSFLCFDNKDRLSHPITSCLSPILSLICQTASPMECVTHWDCWDTLIALSTFIWFCIESVCPSPTKSKSK